MHAATQVQLRTSFVHTLQKASHAAAVAASTNEQEWTVVEKVANSLICQYLHAKQLKHTLTVFVPEVGPRNCDLQDDMVQKLLRLPNDPNAPDPISASSTWLIDMLREKERSADVSSHDIQTQTLDEDHRFLLDAELKRIDDMYWNQSINMQKDQRSFEAQLVAYQTDYDARSQVEFQKEIERIRAMDISIMRMEERKRHAQESDKFRAALQAEYAAKADGLADAEARLRLEFADHRQQLESDLFELRQTLLRELDSVRSKERQLLSSMDVEAMKHANESRRLALLEDNLKERERQLDRTLKDVQVERDGQLRRVTADAEAKVVEKSMALDALEKKLAKESQQLRDSQNEFNAMAQRVAVVDGQLAAARGLHMEQRLKMDLLERERAHLEELLAASRAAQVASSSNHKSNSIALAHANDTIARLEREAKATRVVHEAQIQEKAAAMHDVITQLNAANADLGRLKVAHADAIVAVKVAAYDAVAAERRAAQSAEETLRTQLTEMQARCHEVEAQCHRYQTQSEDDHVHVASLRHEIESLRAMLHTLQYAPSVSHGYMQAGPARRVAAESASSWRMAERFKQPRQGNGDDPEERCDAARVERGGQRVMLSRGGEAGRGFVKKATSLGTSHVNPRDMPPMHEQDLYKQQHEHQQEREDDHARDVAAEPDETVAAAAAQRELEPLRQHQQDAAAAALKASQDTPLDQQLKAHKHAKLDMLEERIHLEAKDTNIQDEMARRAMAARVTAEVTWQQLEDATDQLATSSHLEQTDEPKESEQAEDDKPEEDTTQLRHAALEEDQVQARDGNDDHRGDGGARGYDVDGDESKRMDEKQRAMDAAVEGTAWQGQLENDQSSKVVWETHEQERRDVAARADEATESQDTRNAPDDAKQVARQQRIDDERTAIEAAAVADAREKQHQLNAEIQAKQVKQRENDEAAAAAKLKAEDEATAAKLKAEEAAAAAAKMKADEEAAAAAKLKADEEAAVAAKLKADEAAAAAAKMKADEEAAAAAKLKAEEAAAEAAAKLKAEDEAAAAAKMKVDEEAAAAAKLKADEEAAAAAKPTPANDSSIIDEYRQRAVVRRAEKLRLEQEAKAREQLKKDEEEMKAIKEREDAAAAAALDEERASESGESVLSVGGVGGDDSGDGSADSF
ncbi:hypothetical protein, variant 2 [Aphanomyces astaci]|uniref:LisH domain-containing protein n=1 Tax=Aphanomyces astaci TaxID=112090 RepID=W4GH88_APHAT|nr:hypothetical protein, variant 2 [Aphanomyces astaci]ETV78333.1 hypothetical protein, variant 2 [Aphanomyces astaci]|eukprot:XP_009831912.1 hypothetical protein, variant 2 [Aphanomyces astaci]